MIENKDVLIIGGGIAGLTAAKLLKEHGLNPLVLEAGNRLGGRIRTEEIGGFKVEMGGEWIGADHQEIWEFCRQKGLNLIPHQYHPTIKLDGHEFVDSEEILHCNPQLEKLLQTSAASLTEYEQDLAGISWQEFLKNLGLTEKELLAQQIYGRFSYGRDISSQLASTILQDLQEDVIGRSDRFWIDGGNSQLIDKMAESLDKDEIRLNSQVKKVRQAEQIEVICSDGTVYQSDYLVVTAPTKEVLGINWIPQLPHSQMEALAAVSYTKIAKMHFLFDKCFWGKEEDFLLLQWDNPDALYFSSQGQTGKGGVFTAYAIHENAQEFVELTDRDRVLLVMRLLKEKFGNDVSNPSLYSKAVIWDEAWSSYDRNDFYKISGVLREPWNNIFYASECNPLNYNDQGYMNGGMSAGTWAADQIIELTAA